MKARGWEPAWSPGTPVIETTLQPGVKLNMIVDNATADAIKKGDPVTWGGWATFDSVNSAAVDMRQRSAIKNQFKPSENGPFYVVEMEVTKPLPSKLGFVGAQKDTGGTLRGGGTQIQFDTSIPGSDRGMFIKPISQPKPLN
jgi:filamentous hemagglutinin